MHPRLKRVLPPPRFAAAVAAFAIVSTACSSDAIDRLADRAALAPVEEAPAPAAATAPPTRAPVPAPPAPRPEVTFEEPVAHVPESVVVYQPDLVLRPDDPGTGDLYGVFGASGVEHVAGVAEFEATVVLPGGGSETISVLAVDPATFRSVTPTITAQEAAVWQRIAEGDVAVRHEVAHRLRLELGGEIVLSSLEHGTTLPVRLGALASNGAPPLADLIVPWDVGVELVGARTNMLIVALDGEANVGRVGRELAGLIGGATVETVAGPEQREAALQGGGAAHQFEPFGYLDLGDGLIVIDPAWVAKWIVTVDLPGLGRTRCHRLMVPQLLAALQEVSDAGLAGHFKPDQFAGCHVARHIDWDPTRALSMHAWGLAVDINSLDNWLGEVPTMDLRIVEIFEKWGFEWGGRWARPDGMHFELRHLVQTG